MKKILILGVNGFIGHHLSKRILAATDWEVFGMDMQADRIADLLEDARFHFFEDDITINREWIEYDIRKCDTVLPLVAIATPATTHLANTSQAASSGRIGTAIWSTMAPASGFSTMRCSVMPVSVSPRRIAQLIGTRPRYFGSSEPCRL